MSIKAINDEDNKYCEGIFYVIDDLYNNVVEASTSGTENFRYKTVPKI